MGTKGERQVTARHGMGASTIETLSPQLEYDKKSINSAVGVGDHRMANLEVAEINVPGLIKKLKTSEWLSPLFQRDFVWSTAAVIALVNSIIDARPVGMITLWEQEGDSTLPLEPISIADGTESGRTFFGDANKRPGRFYAILDGRQRSTALALAFGGLRAESGLYRNAGRYFLDVCALDDAERVKFITEKEIRRKNLNVEKSAIAQGLFPLMVENPDAVFEQWMNYIQHIRDPAFYTDGNLPDEIEMARRDRVLKAAFNGIIKTKIALYIVPQTYDLAEICDIFETLNTTGTKVSIVDLIHSNIYSDTAPSYEQPILLRDAIDELGELEGAIGWASTRDRPELIAQMAAAIHVALDNKPEPRVSAKKKDFRISSVKSGDLLALPATHWDKIFSNSAKFASILGNFQHAVAGGYFGLNHCPYPASASIYIALRWYHEFDKAKDAVWGVEHLDSLYRAFFWRNAFATRYDQGFLTQIGTDIRELKTYLSSVTSGTNFDSWRAKANGWLDEYMGKPLDQVSIAQLMSDGSEAGALRRASLLMLIARASRDLLDPGENIHFSSSNLQLHHIYPKDWCANNKSGQNKKILDKKLAGKDLVNSAANLMPMSRASNLRWKKKSPAQVIDEEGWSFDSRAEILSVYFIDRKCFDLLRQGSDGLAEFWEHRANLMAGEVGRRMMV